MAAGALKLCRGKRLLVACNRDPLPERAGICDAAFISDVHILSSLKTLFLPPQQGVVVVGGKAAGKDLEHANNCTRLSGHVSIFPRRSHGDDPICRSPLPPLQSSLTCRTGRKSL